MKTPKTPDPAAAFDPLARYVSIACAVIIVLLPFHAFLTVWGASIFGHYTALRLWKEALLIALLAGAAVVGVRQRPDWSAAKKLFGPTRLCSVAKLYGLVVVLSGTIAYLAGGVSAKALVYGLILDLRFLMFFGIVWLVSAHSGQWIHARWRKLLLIPAAIVLIFGILQFTVLPADFLKHFGYGPSTIAAVQTIDQKDAYQRVQSTLRGANPLGAYLVVIVAAFGALLLERRGRAAGAPRRQWMYAAGLAATCAVLALTFSRSAWIGAVLALGWLLYIWIGPGRLRQSLLVAGAAGVLVLAGLGYALRDNDVFQNTFLHTDEHSQSAESSNAGHFSATFDNVSDVVYHPWGGGTGTAGPASVYNSKQPPKIAENYFVQIGQETGLLGLGLFVAINIMLARELWRRRESTLARALLASLIGISFINLLSHAWTDDTISYIWWGLAGAVMVLPLKHKESTKEHKA